jgi:hypothetical protein
VSKPIVEVLPGSFNSTIYRITAEYEEDVNNAVEHIIARYNPTGYGTRVEKKGMTKEGQYFAQVWRSNTCD